MWVSRTHNNVLFMHENIETIMIEQIFYGCEKKIYAQNYSFSLNDLEFLF